MVGACQTPSSSIATVNAFVGSISGATQFQVTTTSFVSVQKTSAEAPATGARFVSASVQPVQAKVRVPTVSGVATVAERLVPCQFV
jgi:hypothetical protein